MILQGKKSLSEVLQMADQKRHQGAGSCSVMLRETFHELRKETILEKFKKFFTRQKGLMNTHNIVLVFDVYSSSGSSHVVVLKAQYDPEGYLGGTNKIQIFCDCPDFIYRGAYELGQTGNLFRSKGTDIKLGPAISTPPKGKNFQATICKHSLAALQYFMNYYTSLMNG